MAQPRERWIVLSNCQSLGLSRAITAVARTVQCDSCDIWQMPARLEEDPDYFRRYDLALVLPEVRARPAFPADALPASVDLPSFIFGGYHPDCCYVRADGNLITEGLTGPYQSMIVLAAYKEGLGVGDTARLFTDSLYRQAGYYLQWDAQRDALVDQYAAHGFDVRPLFRSASRGKAMMHTPDHPTIEVLMDIARVVLASLDRPVHAVVPPPTDNLAVTSWPVYPEVGEQLGVAGAYLFRPRNEYAAMDLENYIGRALEEFRPWDRSLLRVARDVQPRLQLIRRLIQEGM